jgi:hypothetical protein
MSILSYLYSYTENLNLGIILLSDLIDTDTIWKTFAKEGPLILLFLIITVYLGWQSWKKDKEIAKLNDYIRESDKENINLLNQVNNTLDKVLNEQGGFKDKIDELYDFVKEQTKSIKDDTFEINDSVKDILKEQINNLKEYLTLTKGK